MRAPLLPGQIDHWPLARLRPYARNIRTHDADQVAKIVASMAAQLGMSEAPICDRVVLSN